MNNLTSRPPAGCGGVVRSCRGRAFPLVKLLPYGSLVYRPLNTGAGQAAKDNGMGSTSSDGSRSRCSSSWRANVQPNGLWSEK